MLLFFLTLWVFIMGGMFPAVAKSLPAYRLSSEGSGYQPLTLVTADLVPCCSPSGYEVERTTDAAGRLETVTVKYKGTAIHAYTNSFNANSHEISGVAATGFSSSYSRANPDTRAITKITRGTVEQNCGRGTAGRITSAGSSISDIPITARLYINETEMTPFTGGWFFNIPSPGQDGGWVPWVVKGVLLDAGDHEPNDDAIAEVAGNTWVPPANEPFTYDADGNRESSSLWNYGWDGRNMLVSATTKNYDTSSEGWRVTCDYDAEGRRFKKTIIHKTTRGEQVKETLDNITFIWDGWNLIYERHSNQFGMKTFDRKYVWGEDLGGGTGGASGAGGAGGLLLIRETRGQSATVDYYPLYDGSGHVVGLTDSAGTLVAQYTYGPFGELISASGPMADANPIRYATKYFDKETGLYYFGRRYYDPATGQWLNREPLGEDESLNLYAYCHNDPVNSVDVLGLWQINTQEEANIQRAIWLLMMVSEVNKSPIAPPSQFAAYFPEASDFGLFKPFGPDDYKRALVMAHSQALPSVRTASWEEADLASQPVMKPGLMPDVAVRALTLSASPDPNLATGYATIVLPVGAGGFLLNGAAKVAQISKLLATGMSLGRPALTGINVEARTGTLLAANTPLALPAPRQVAANWGMNTYKHGGEMYAIEHTMYRHASNSGFANVSALQRAQERGKSKALSMMLSDMAPRQEPAPSSITWAVSSERTKVAEPQPASEFTSGMATSSPLSQSQFHDP